MSALADLLGPDEQIIHETRQHWFVVLRRIGLLLAGLVVLAAALWFSRRADWLDNEAGDWLGIALLVLAGVVALVGLWRIAGWWTERLYLTTSKVVYVNGVLNKDVMSTPFVKIDEVKLARPFLGRILGFGRLDVENAAGGREPLAGLEYLPHPVELYRLVTERSRNQRMIEGGAHRDDDGDGLVDEARPVPARPASTRGDRDEDGGRWVPTGDATSDR